MGLGAQLVVFVLLSVSLRAWRFPLKSSREFFGIATVFLEHFRAEGGGGGSVAIPGIHVLKGYIGYYVPLVLGHSMWPDPLPGQ